MGSGRQSVLRTIVLKAFIHYKIHFRVLQAKNVSARQKGMNFFWNDYHQSRSRLLFTRIRNNIRPHLHFSFLSHDMSSVFTVPPIKLYYESEPKFTVNFDIAFNEKLLVIVDQTYTKKNHILQSTLTSSHARLFAVIRYFPSDVP